GPKLAGRLMSSCISTEKANRGPGARWVISRRLLERRTTPQIRCARHALCLPTGWPPTLRRGYNWPVGSSGPVRERLTMARAQHIDTVLRNWPYEPGDVSVRLVTGSD